MIRSLLLALAALFAALPATAQETAPRTERVRMATDAGEIVLAIEVERAPVTAANFLRYVDARRFDGIDFYRAMKLDWGGLIQAGQRDPAKLYPPIAHEPTTKTGLSHTEGTISMARFAPGTATADFTIMLGDMTGLDASPTATGDNQGFAAFGRVIEGMDVVKRILAMPTSPTEGEGVMRGQMLSPKIRINTVRRVAE
jgi:peptidyl-prolyl cis-trans isomerase A (cyclophilin A)